jgi:histidine triad (HIT) family protein
MRVARRSMGFKRALMVRPARASGSRAWTADGAAVDSRSVASAGGCTFCGIAAGEIAAEVVYEDERQVAFLDHRPVFRGHTLLTPRQHVVTLKELPADDVPAFLRTAQRLERAVEDATGADGSLVLVNNVVSQSVPHLHLHVIPRRFKDGLRFFLGPRERYTAEAPIEQVAAAIRAALAAPPTDPTP